MDGATTATAPGPGPRRPRVRDRVPVRLRHHWKPAATLCAGLAVLMVFFGDARVSPFVTSASSAEDDQVTEDVPGTVGLYDTSVAHSIQLAYEPTDFNKMMKEFKDDGTKDWISADLTIDGTQLNDVGIRLKGNSTLMALRGGRGGMPQLPGGAGPGGAQQPGGQRQDGAAPTLPGGEQGGAGGQPGAGGLGAVMSYNLSADKPEELPWLIKVDEFVEGRTYQGLRQFTLRPGSNDKLPLNEAVSLSLTKESQQHTQRYAFTRVKVNNRPTAARLVVENPSKDYAEDELGGNGVLYKAQAGGSFAYRGDDPSDYETSFKQLSKLGSQDLEPLIKLLKWADGASDEEFARDLDKYVDVDSFARYVATQNLLMNFDDMAGPGKNYLLWYDLDTRKFTILSWDYNLTFSGSAESGPDDNTSMGLMPGGFPGGGGGNTGNGQGDGSQGGAQPDTMPSGMPEMPEGFPQEMPEGFPQEMPTEMPEGFPQGMPGGANGGGDIGGEQPGGGLMAGHVLKEKFLKLDAFDKVYKTAYRELYQTWFASGTALTALDQVADAAKRTGAQAKTIDTAADKLRDTIKQRSAALAKNKEVAG